MFFGRRSSVQEGYVAGEVEIHLQFWLVKPDLANYCVVFEQAADVGFSRAQQTAVENKEVAGRACKENRCLLDLASSFLGLLYG
jgi:hypothetical protein